MYIIYTPNLGLEIAVPGREREQGRFRGSTEGARGSTMGECRQGRSRWEPEVAAWYPTIAAHVGFY